MTPMGVGIGWRPDIDITVERMPGVDFVEVIAENIQPKRLPTSLRLLRGRGIPVVAHGVSLSLGGADPLDETRVRHLARCAEALEAPVVSDHMAFVRSGRTEAGHLLPVPLTRDCLAVMVANVQKAQQMLPAPIAIENVAAVLEWPDAELTEAQFLAELIDRTGARLLLDVENLYANWVNFGRDPIEALGALPLEHLAYVHIGGGILSHGVWHDTHAHPVHPGAWALLEELARRVAMPGVLLERDENYPTDRDLRDELGMIAHILSTSRTAGQCPPAPPGKRQSAIPSPAGGRRDLANSQRDLLGSLIGSAPPPTGFDHDRLRVQSAVLARKRGGDA